MSGTSWSSGLNTWSSFASAEQKGQGLPEPHTKTSIKPFLFEVPLTSFTIKSPLRIFMMHLESRTATEKRKTLTFRYFTSGVTFCMCQYWEEETGHFFSKAVLTEGLFTEKRASKGEKMHQPEFFLQGKRKETHKPRLSLFLSLVGCLSWLVHVCKCNNEPITVRSSEGPAQTLTRAGHWLGWENLGISSGRTAQYHVITRNHQVSL